MTLIEEYPLRQLISRYIFPLMFFAGLDYFVNKKILLFDFLFIVFLFLFFYSFFFQFEFKKIIINGEKIVILYPLNYLIRKKSINIDQVELVKYKPKTNSWADPFLKIYSKNKRPIRLTFPYNTLIKIVSHLEQIDIKTKKIPY